MCSAGQRVRTGGRPSRHHRGRGGGLGPRPQLRVRGHPGQAERHGGQGSRTRRPFRTVCIGADALQESPPGTSRRLATGRLGGTGTSARGQECLVLACAGRGRPRSSRGGRGGFGRPAPPASPRHAALGHGKLAAPRAPRAGQRRAAGRGVAGRTGVSGEAGLINPCVKGRLRSSHVPAQGHWGWGTAHVTPAEGAMAGSEPWPPLKGLPGRTGSQQRADAQWPGTTTQALARAAGDAHRPASGLQNQSRGPPAPACPSGHPARAPGPGPVLSAGRGRRRRCLSRGRAARRRRDSGLNSGPPRACWWCARREGPGATAATPLLLAGAGRRPP